MSILLLVAFIILYMQMKRLKKTRQDLKTLNTELQGLNGQLLKVNQDLQESNHIKEEYMAQFFELCSAYIDKLDNTRKGILKKVSNNQIDDLTKELKSQDFIKTELDDLYHNFDVIFLNLYPTFIQEFNSLLKPEERLTLKQDELLNSELRIFALIRLGISDSTKIARFLRYSLRTVYNYRVKVRNKVLGTKEDFDEQIKEIGNLKY
jgi:DNA-binding CsgD family transcriptional regulator